MSAHANGHVRERPVVAIPEREELTARLSVSRSIDERVSYVLALLRPARQAAEAFDTFERELAARDTTIEGMRTELRALHELVGGLDKSDRAALDARREMLAKLNRARGELQHFEQTVDAALDRLRETMKK